LRFKARLNLLERWVDELRVKAEEEPDVAAALAGTSLGDLIASEGGGTNDHSFKFVQTSDTGGTLTAGVLYLAGTAKTITGLPATLASVTVTTKYYITIELAASTAAWNSTTGAYPAGDGDTEIWPILELTCADSVITGVKQCQCSDIHISITP
jgi:hypothetical protein